MTLSRDFAIKKSREMGLGMRGSKEGFLKIGELIVCLLLMRKLLQRDDVYLCLLPRSCVWDVLRLHIFFFSVFCSAFLPIISIMKYQASLSLLFFLLLL